MIPRPGTCRKAEIVKPHQTPLRPPRQSSPACGQLITAASYQLSCQIPPPARIFKGFPLQPWAGEGEVGTASPGPGRV